MQPVAVFQTLMRVNKPVAIFLLAGGGLLALSVIALNFMGDAQTTLWIALVILGLAFVVTIIVYAIHNPTLRALFCWTFFGVFLLFLVGFVDSALQLSGRLPAPVCFVRMFSQSRAACELENMPRQEVQLNGGAVFGTGPDLLWQAQAAPEAVVRDTPYDLGKIYVQVLPDVDVTAAQNMVTALAPLGWLTEGGIDGLDMVKVGPDVTEVRYFHADDRDNALALAQALKAVLGGQDVFLADFSTSGLVSPTGQLEIWLGPNQING